MGSTRAEGDLVHGAGGAGLLDRLLFDHVRDVVVLTDPSLRVIDANRATAEALGCVAEELAGRDVLELVTPEYVEATRTRLERVFGGAADLPPEECAFRTRGGGSLPVEVSSTPVTRDGRVVAALCIGRDLTPRRRMEAALRESEAHLRNVFEQWPVGMSVVATDGRILRANAALSGITGYPSDELVGASLHDLVHPDDREEDVAELAELVAGTVEAQHSHRRYVRRDGTTIWVRIRSSLVYDTAGSSLHLVVQTTDVTEQRATYAALQRSEAMLAEAQRISHIGSWEWEVAADVVSWSDELYRIYGLDRTSFPGTYDGVLAHVHPDDLELVRTHVARALETGAPYAFRHRFLRADGSTGMVESRGTVVRDEEGSVVRLAGTARDVTQEHEADEERRLLRAELVHVHKMEAIGILAGGVAHDFNNALTAIRGYAELVLSELDRDSPAWRDADALRRVAEHAASLPRQLLAFARRQTLQPRELDLATLVTEAEGLLDHVVGPACTVHVSRGRGPSWVRCDPGQLQLVLVNLALNARDAMPEGGVVTVETGAADLDAEAAAGRSVSPGRYATLVVTDTGHGMDEATRARALEPFFTTKGEEGAGLGLATVYGIVTQSGGGLEIESEAGRGTRVEILLPAIGPAPLIEDATPRAPAPEAAGSTVLLVEDEPSVLRVAQRALRRAGYEVLVAASAAEARSHFDLHQQAIDLLVSDVRLPDANGTELAQSLHRQAPGLPVLYVSGYTDEVLEPGPAAFLAKPFSPAELVTAVESTLASARGQAG
jgi:PAS domain S-box-containing protein